MISEDQKLLQTNLIHAIKSGDRDIVADLLKNSLLNPALADQEGVTPLLQAVWSDQKEIVEMLLPHLSNEEINMQEKWDGSCPFLAAANMGRTDIFKILLDRLAPDHIHIKDTLCKSSALHLAAYGGHLDVIRLMLPHLSHKDIGYKNTMGSAAMGWADCKKSKQLIQSRIDELQAKGAS